MVEKPKKDMSKGRISIIIVGMINAALTMILIGGWLLNEYHFLPFSNEGFDYAIALFAVFSLVFTAFAILNNYLTEGMFFLITSLVAFICLIMKFSEEELVTSLLYMMVAYFVCAVIFHIRGEHVFELGSIVAGISLLGINIMGFNAPWALGLFVFAGILILISGCMSLADMGPEWMRARNISVKSASSLNYATTVTYTSGTFLSCLVFFSIGIDNNTQGLMTFKLIVGILTIFAGIYGMHNGCHRRGSDLIVLSIYSIISAVSAKYDMGDIPFLNLILAVPLITSAIQEYQNGNPLKMVCSGLYAIVMVTDVFFGSTMFFQVLVLITKIVTLYDCVTTWFIYETGWAPRFMRYNKKDVTFDE